MDVVDIKKLLHSLFQKREAFVCRKSQAVELKNVLTDVRLVLQGFKELVRPELINPIACQLKTSFGDVKFCLDATTCYIARLEQIIQAKDQMVA